MLRAHGVTYTYPESSTAALKAVSLDFQPGEIILLAGPNGGGKSTFLKCLTGVIPYLNDGTFSGEVWLNGKTISGLRPAQLAGQIGIVLQDPEVQVSCMTVAEEARFGLQNMMLDLSEVFDRSALALQQLGIEQLAPRSVLALSGGQLQRLSLAALLAMRPSVLLLDEPVTNLDPLGVASVIEALELIRPFVEVMIISSHWMDPFLHLATRIVIMGEGEVQADLPIMQVITQQPLLTQWGIDIPHIFRFPYLPPEYQIKPLRSTTYLQVVPTAVKLDQVTFQYPRGGAIPIRNVDLEIGRFQQLALVGHNGEGKSTLARLIADLIKPTQGVITRHKNSTVGLMLQKPTLGFLGTTVREELAFGGQLTDKQIEETLELFGLTPYATSSPFALSGGEQRRLSLSVALSNHPNVLILDEPTAGLDALQVEKLAAMLRLYGGALISITHDTRLVAKSERVVVIGDGRIIFDDQPTQLSAEQMRYLGYDRVNPTVALCIDQLPIGIPMQPEDLEVVRHASL